MCRIPYSEYQYLWPWHMNKCSHVGARFSFGQKINDTTRTCDTIEKDLVAINFLVIGSKQVYQVCNGVEPASGSHTILVNIYLMIRSSNNLTNISELN